jgi:tRNA threonylcarbamoyladenosine biosynthesis protein TsaE
MASTEVTSESAAATERAAWSIAAGLEPGDVVLVSGEVGVGKTTFVRGACRALGVRERVTSPSFTIGHRYEGRVPVSHVDLFRLDSLAGEDPGLLSDYLSPDAVGFVEWPQAAVPELEPGSVVLRVQLTHLGGDRRGIAVTGADGLVERLRQALTAPAGDPAAG